MVLAPVLAFAGALRLGPFTRFGLGLGVGRALRRAHRCRAVGAARRGDGHARARSGVLLGRPRATGSILAAAVLALLVLDPWLVYAIGFQLSVAATAGMVALASPLGERFRRFCRRPSPSLPEPRSPRSSASRRCCSSISTRCRASPSSRTSWRSLRSHPHCSSGSSRRRSGSSRSPWATSSPRSRCIPMRYLELWRDRLAKAPIAWITSGGGPFVLIIGGVRLRRVRGLGAAVGVATAAPAMVVVAIALRRWSSGQRRSASGRRRR